MQRSAATLDANPAPPRNPLPLRRQLAVIRAFNSGPEALRDAGGPVTRLRLGPRWLVPPVVVATSPRAARDILSPSPAEMERNRVHDEMRHLLGPNLFDMRYRGWLPRRRALQPVFTKQHVHRFGGHMAEVAETVAHRWTDGARIDLDTESRRVTLGALGRSVLGLDLESRTEAVADPVRTAANYIADRGANPFRAPRWLPTPARRRARAASAALHRLAGEILQACRTDPERDAPLVRALIAARDPATGRELSDAEIRCELVIFMLAGHDTTSTTLAYALWALGHHRDIQERVRAEAADLGGSRLAPADVPRLSYAVAVLHEALRLCPPAPVVTRTATSDIDIAGYRVQAGTELVVGISALHRDPTLWDRPLDFNPERFNPENSAGRDRWQYLPFGGGPRSCIGDHFAMLEATLALATIIRDVEIRSSADDFPVATPFTAVAAGPVWAVAHRIKHDR
ncbi:MAG: cytochrome P450 [Mycobacterium sp.]